MRRSTYVVVLLVGATMLLGACDPVGTDGLTFTEAEPLVVDDDLELGALLPEIPTIRMPNLAPVHQAEAGAQATLDGAAPTETDECVDGEAQGRHGDSQFRLIAEPGSDTTFVEAGPAHLLSHHSAADGSGEFFSRQDNVELSVRVNDDGSGALLRTSPDSTLSITAHARGSAELFSRTDEQFFTVHAEGDGSGEFYFESEQRTTTVRADDAGGWELSDTRSDGTTTLVVNSDRSGEYRETGVKRTQRVLGPGQVDIEPPTFQIDGTFPRLGQLLFDPMCVEEEPVPPPPVVVLGSEVLFAVGSSVLRPEADVILDNYVASLPSVDQALQVVGHTDALGSAESNLELSLDRAQAVAEALQVRGLPDVRPIGLGEQRPVAPNEKKDGSDNPEGRAQNRRVEITWKGSAS